MAKKRPSKAPDIYRDLTPPLNKIMAMNELAPDPNRTKLLTRPGAQSPDVAALSGLLDMMNNNALTGAIVPRGEDPKAALKAPPAASNEPLPSEGLPQPHADPAPVPNKFFFTGRLKVGKDHVATSAGLKIFGFADPMYAMAKYFFGQEISGTAGKDLPGVRAFLQAIGQWGRATINDQYPLTPARALFIESARKLGVAGEFGEFGVDWAAHGRNENLWLDAALLRIELHLSSQPEARVAITNVRFENELKALQQAGWSHWHVMTSAKTWSERLLKSKLTPESPAVKDVTERLAAGFDGNVIKQISTQKSGPLLRVIWNDNTPAPSPRLHTLGSFLSALNVARPITHISTDDF